MSHQYSVVFLFPTQKNSIAEPDNFLDAPEIMRLEGQPTVFAYNVLKAATKNFHSLSQPGLKLMILFSTILLTYKYIYIMS